MSELFPMTIHSKYPYLCEDLAQLTRFRIFQGISRKLIPVACKLKSPTYFLELAADGKTLTGQDILMKSALRGPFFPGFH